PSTPPKRRRPWAFPLICAAVGLVVGLVVLGGYALLRSDGGTDAANRDTFTLTGTFTLYGGAESDGVGGCQGEDGFGDVRAGAAVTVYDASGEVIAVGALTDPKASDPELIVACAFTVTVPEVPRGERFYGVEVSHRGKVTVSAEQAEAGGFSASLGD
ncbi:hypothetical protein PV350_41255, partial [Streptomyces sp. PA03-6a]|nr:hypothetical protein [Streptomyces sp. PA03-6a]